MVNRFELTDFKELGFYKEKNQIILADSKRDYKNYIRALKYRYNKKNPYIPNYLITKDGLIYKFIQDEAYSSFMENIEVDKKSIIIVLENNGWLKKNPIEETYLNWVGDIYKKDVYEKKWRDFIFWEPYTDKQLETLSILVKELCDKFNIPKKTIGHNVKTDDVNFFKGVVSKSNYDFINKDVNPSFDFKLFKELIEDV